MNIQGCFLSFPDFDIFNKFANCDHTGVMLGDSIAVTVTAHVNLAEYIVLTLLTGPNNIIRRKEIKITFPKRLDASFKSVIEKHHPDISWDAITKISRKASRLQCKDVLTELPIVSATMEVVVIFRGMSLFGFVRDIKTLLGDGCAKKNSKEVTRNITDSLQEAVRLEVNRLFNGFASTADKTIHEYCNKQRLFVGKAGEDECRLLYLSNERGKIITPTRSGAIEQKSIYEWMVGKNLVPGVFTMIFAAKLSLLDLWKLYKHSNDFIEVLGHDPISEENVDFDSIPYSISKITGNLSAGDDTLPFIYIFPIAAKIPVLFRITIYTRRMELRDLYEDNGMLSDIESLVKQLKLIDELGLIFNPLDHNKKGD